MLQIDNDLKSRDLESRLERFFQLAGDKIITLAASWDPGKGSPVFTENGRYLSRGWTEWTQGFQYGCALLQFDVTGDQEFLDLGREKTIRFMAPHLTHVGVHDHGFNNSSTYGNLLRLAWERRIDTDRYEKELYKLAICVSGAIQASRWTSLPDGCGYIYSFNGPHSLFVDTMRSLRVLSLSHTFGHYLLGEQDQKINLLHRSIQHAETTARYNVYFASGRDIYDERGRVAHEALFNPVNGSFRCVSSQQGYSPFTTWSRGHAWVLLGFSEQLEFLNTVAESEFLEIEPQLFASKAEVLKRFESIAEATAEYYLSHVPTDGIPYWDFGAPGLVHMKDFQQRPADPDNGFEPVDSSAAVITAQGLLRFGHYLAGRGAARQGERFIQAGLTIAGTLLSPPYLSVDPSHQGLLLHSVYHRPNGWDYVPKGARIPCGESSMWGDYHLMELAVYISRLAKNQAYYQFFPEARDTGYMGK